MTEKEILFIAFCFEIVLVALGRENLCRQIRDMANEVIKQKKDEEIEQLNAQLQEIEIEQQLPGF